MVKQLVYIGFYIFAKVKCDAYANSVDKNATEYGKRIDLVTKVESLGLVLLMFGIQHALFIGARIGVWLFLQIFCLGCVCIDDDAPELR